MIEGFNTHTHTHANTHTRGPGYMDSYSAHQKADSVYRLATAQRTSLRLQSCSSFSLHSSEKEVEKKKKKFQTVLEPFLTFVLFIKAQTQTDVDSRFWTTNALD